MNPENTEQDLRINCWECDRKHLVDEDCIPEPDPDEYHDRMKEEGW